MVRGVPTSSLKRIRNIYCRTSVMIASALFKAGIWVRAYTSWSKCVIEFVEWFYKTSQMSSHISSHSPIYFYRQFFVWPLSEITRHSGTDIIQSCNLKKKKSFFWAQDCLALRGNSHIAQQPDWSYQAAVSAKLFSAYCIIKSMACMQQH